MSGGSSNRWMALIVCVAASAGCTKAGRSLLRASITADSSITGLETVDVRVMAGSRTVATPSFSWTPPTLMIGAYLPDDVTGPVSVFAQGRAGNDVIAQSTTGTGVVEPGKASDIVDLVLKPYSPPGADGGGGDGPASDDGGSDAAAESPPPADAGPDEPGGAEIPDAGQGGMPEAGPDAPSDLPIVVSNPPSLTKCVEIEHAGSKATCNETTADGDIEVFSVAFSPDGSLLATAGSDGRIKLWKVTGTTLAAEGRVIAAMAQARIAFSPDGQRLAAGGDNGDLFLYDLGTNQRTSLTGHQNRIHGVAFRGDGARLVTVDNGAMVRVWDLATNQSIVNLTLFAGQSTPYSLAIVKHATGAALWAAVGLTKEDVPATGTGGTLPADAAYLWFGDLANPAQSTLLAADDTEIDAAAISPDDHTLVAGGHSGIAHVWNIANPAQPQPAGMIDPARRDNQEAIPVSALSFGLDGRFLAEVSGAFNYGGSMRVIDASTWMSRALTFSTYYGVSVALRPQGNIYVSGESACGLVQVCAD